MVQRIAAERPPDPQVDFVGCGLGTRRVVTEAFEGTLTVDLRNASKKELVFRAVAVEEKESPAKLAERADEMVKKAIEKYPPKK